MVDLDSNPTKLIEVVETGKQMLMTRGALTTFSVANDIAKYFAIVPAAFVTTYYPVAVTVIARLAFPAAAGGSLIVHNGQPVGSALIGQSFTAPEYFWGRPSATVPRPYNALASGGSNQGPLNPALMETVRGRIAVLKVADPGNARPIPLDLVTASASGLDPHISPAAAQYQVERVARARQLQPAAVQSLVVENTESRQWGLFGEPRVNVLRLNLALDDLHSRTDNRR